VQHPAAKMLVLASQQQEQECGDGTNFVLVFAGALLDQAEQLLRMVCVVLVIVIFCSSAREIVHCNNEYLFFKLVIAVFVLQLVECLFVLLISTVSGL